jgi:exoribonuclease R
MSFGVRLDDNGKVDRYRIVPSILNNIVNLSYDEMDSIISDDTKRQTKHAAELKKQHYDLFLKLAEYAKRRRSLRIDQGAVIIVTPHAEVRVKPNPSTGTSVASFAVENDYTRNSKGVVMEMMLLVGEIAANYFSERGTPVLYRVQPLSSGAFGKPASNGHFWPSFYPVCREHAVLCY